MMKNPDGATVNGANSDLHFHMQHTAQDTKFDIWGNKYLGRNLFEESSTPQLSLKPRYFKLEV